MATSDDGLSEVANAIDNSLNSPSELDANGETANVVDALFAIARSLEASARHLGLNGASTPMGAFEALSKSVEDGSTRIADALADLAQAIREHN